MIWYAPRPPSLTVRGAIVGGKEIFGDVLSCHGHRDRRKSVLARTIRMTMSLTFPIIPSHRADGLLEATLCRHDLICGRYGRCTQAFLRAEASG